MRNSKACISGKMPSLRDRANKRCPQNIEGLRRNYQHITRACLLTAFDWIQIDVEDVAALHLQSLIAHGRRIQPFPIFRR